MPAISIMMAMQVIIYSPQIATIGIQITAAATNDMIEGSPASVSYTHLTLPTIA